MAAEWSSLTDDDFLVIKKKEIEVEEGGREKNTDKK